MLKNQYSTVFQSGTCLNGSKVLKMYKNIFSQMFIIFISQFPFCLFFWNETRITKNISSGSEAELCEILIQQEVVKVQIRNT